MFERPRTILNAYLAASLAAGFTLLLGLSLVALVGLLFEGRWQAAGSAAIALFVVPLMLGGWVGFLVVALAFVPALIVIGLAEVARIRAAAFYASTATITAIACWAFFLRKEGDWFAVPGPALASAIDWSVAGIAGLIGGLVYWAIAGKTAGNWRVPQQSKT